MNIYELSEKVRVRIIKQYINLVKRDKRPLHLFLIPTFMLSTVGITVFSLLIALGFNPPGLNQDMFEILKGLSYVGIAISTSLLSLLFINMAGERVKFKDLFKEFSKILFFKSYSKIYLEKLLKYEHSISEVIDNDCYNRDYTKRYLTQDEKIKINELSPDELKNLQKLILNKTQKDMLFNHIKNLGTPNYELLQNLLFSSQEYADFIAEQEQEKFDLKARQEQAAKDAQLQNMVLHQDILDFIQMTPTQVLEKKEIDKKNHLKLAVKKYL